MILVLRMKAHIIVIFSCCYLCALYNCLLEFEFRKTLLRSNL